MANFRKDTYQIAVHKSFNESGFDTREGWISPKAMFGITKEYDNYRVTHLPSGMSIQIADRKLLRDVKAVVLRAEAAFDWQESDMHKIAQLNGVGVPELRRVFQD